MHDFQSIIGSIPELSFDEKLALRDALDEALHAGPVVQGGAGKSSALIGLFADTPEVLDGVLEAAYESRSRALWIE